MPYAFYVSPRESSSFPKSLFCLAGSLPWDRAPTLHPKPAAGLGELTPFPKVFPILLRSVFPLLLPLLPYISWTLWAAPPSCLYGRRRRMGRQQHCPDLVLQSSGSAPDWNCNRSVQLLGGKKIQQLVQNPKLLKECVGLWGVPRGGRVAVGG